MNIKEIDKKIDNIKIITNKSLYYKIIKYNISQMLK